MSSVVKFNKVKINTDRKVLIHHSRIQNIPKRVLDQGDDCEGHIGIQMNCSKLIKEADEQAKAIILKAREEAKQIVAQAQVEADKQVKKAREDGYSVGYSEGYQEGYELALIEGRNLGRKEYESLIKETEQLKDRYIHDYENIYRASEENMLMLAMDIARKIIGDALDSQGNTFINIAYNALKLVKGQKQVQLKVSSQDFSHILDNKDLLISRLEGMDDIDIVEDAFLDRGSCIIDTGNGIIDGSVKTQMDIIESTLSELSKAIP